MIPAERQNYILSCLAERDVVSIVELAERLNASHMTVRRDIQSLERGGEVISVTGGVKLVRRLERELRHLRKLAFNTSEKRAVGRAAAMLVKDGMVIFLDAGTTMLEIARNIAGRRNLTVVTNDFVVCAYLSNNSECTLYHSGGMVSRSNQSCVGGAASEALTRFNYDVAFVSTSSWTIAGLSSSSEAKGVVKLVAVTHANRSVLVSGSSKYGVVAAVNILPIHLFDTIVTDQRVAPDVNNALREIGLEIILAEDEEPAEERVKRETVRF